MQDRTPWQRLASLAVLVVLFLGLLWIDRHVERSKHLTRPVEVRGVRECYNWSLGGPDWIARHVEERPVRLLFRDGDLLALDPDDGALVPYRVSDGASITIDGEGPRILLDGRTVAVTLGREAAYGWVRGASRGDLEGLRYLAAGGEIGEDRVTILRRLAEVNPEVDLFLAQGAAGRVLPLFRPRRIFFPADTRLDAGEIALVQASPDLEVLIIDAESVPDLSFLDGMPRLRKLVLAEYRPHEMGPLPEGLQELETLTIVSESRMKDLSTIQHLTGLRELDVAWCEGLEDLGGLESFPSLEALSITVNPDAFDARVFDPLRGLRRLHLHGDITQDDFRYVLGRVPGLRDLIIVGCEGIDDLRPLLGLRHLEHLVIVETEVDLTPLLEMQGLRFLVLPGEVFSGNEEVVRRLERALPDCTVAAGEGVCLGSGWILLLVPVVALGLAARRGRTR
jgi:hypothetical protein